MSLTADTVITAPDFEHVPVELRSLRQWVLWRREPKPGNLNEHTKMPYQINGKHARVNKPETWSGFDDVCAAYRAGGYDGIGLVFMPDDGLAGVDLDDCFDEAGNITPLASDIVKRLGSYTERSVSGGGLHVIVRADLSGKKGSKPLEFFGSGCFLTFTGDIYDGLNEIRAAGDELAALMADTKKPAENKHDGGSLRASEADRYVDSLPDNELWRRIKRSSKHGADITALLNGDLSKYDNDESDADIALCGALASWTRKYPERMDNMFRQTCLFRPEKWDKPHRASDGATYGQMTIELAISNCTQMYDPPELQAKGKVSAEVELENAVLAEHDLLYAEATGFYEYAPNRGIWQRRTETTVASYVKHAMGSAAVSSKIAAVVRQLRAGTVDEEAAADFNRRHLIVFTNGVLNTETLEFSASFSRGCYCTIALPYPYDSGAKCPEWERFLKTALGNPDIVSMPDWLASDVKDPDGQARAQLLQEFAGYTLWPSNRVLQQAMVLVGTGSNGKSALLNTLAKVFGPDNVSRVAIADLAKDFHRMPLKDKLLNIATDEGRSFRDGEEVFKCVVAGDAIADSLKGRDMVRFEPRCKMWLAVNQLPKANDKSFGFLRRFLFVSFPNRFGTASASPRVLEADPRLEQKLEAELPGIFNWCLEGCRRLRTQMAFTKGPDQARLSEELAIMADPLRAFYAEVLTQISGRVTRGELYAKYREWCMKNGHLPQSNSSFYTGLRSVLTETGRSFREGRSNGWYFEFAALPGVNTGRGVFDDTD